MKKIKKKRKPRDFKQSFTQYSYQCCNRARTELIRSRYFRHKFIELFSLRVVGDGLRIISFPPPLSPLNFRRFDMTVAQNSCTHYSDDRHRNFAIDNDRNQYLYFEKKKQFFLIRLGSSQKQLIFGNRLVDSEVNILLPNAFRNISVMSVNCRLQWLDSTRFTQN